MQVPAYWRGPENKLYRIRRECKQAPETPGRVYVVRAFAIGDDTTPAAEASVALLQHDMLEMVRLNQQVPTPEQLYSEAFQTVMGRLDRT